MPCTCAGVLQLEKVRLDSEAAQRRMEAEAAQARVAVAQAESMYKSERAQWVTSLDAQRFEVGVILEQWWKRALASGPWTAAPAPIRCSDCNESSETDMQHCGSLQ